MIPNINYDNSLNYVPKINIFYKPLSLPPFTRFRPSPAFPVKKQSGHGTRYAERIKAPVKN
jgi:hypothetical protein